MSFLGKRISYSNSTSRYFEEVFDMLEQRGRTDRSRQTYLKRNQRYVGVQVTAVRQLVQKIRALVRSESHVTDDGSD